MSADRPNPDGPGPGAGDPGGGTCTVWWAAPVAPQDAPGLVALLDAHERDRLARLRRAADRARYLAAHALARLALGAVLDTDPAGIALDRTCACGQQHGKPRLADLDRPGFSLSHSGELVVVALHPERPVGVDVEQERPLADLASMLRHVRSPGDTETGFFALWTRKEALLKATGIGLTATMAAITLGPGPVLRSWTGAHAPHGPMWVRDLPVREGYRAALAGPGTTAPPVRVADGAALLRSRSA